MNTIQGPFQFAAATTRRLDLEVMSALAGIMLLHAWAYGLQAVIIAGVAYVFSLGLVSIAGFPASLRRQLHDGYLSAVLLLTAMMLPANAALGIAVCSMVLVVCLQRAVFGAWQSPFNTAASGLLIYIILTGAEPLPPVVDYSHIPLAVFTGNYFQSLLAGEAMAIVELRNLVIVLAALVLIARNSIGWRVPLAMAITLATPAVLLQEPAQAQLSLWLHSDLPLLLFFLAPDSRSGPAGAKARLLFGVLVAAACYLLLNSYPALVAISISVLFANLWCPLLERMSIESRNIDGHRYAAGDKS